jgi:hypothetical protein
MPVLYWPPISQEDCAGLERVLGFTLPGDYKAFLGQWNGLFVDLPDWVNLPFAKVDDGWIAFSFLFGFRVPNKNQDIEKQTSYLKDELAHIGDIAVIGEDGGDNFFVLTGGTDSGKVYYWDRTHLHHGAAILKADIPEKNECGNLYLVANTFGEFWALLSGHLQGFQFAPRED